MRDPEVLNTEYCGRTQQEEAVRRGSGFERAWNHTVDRQKFGDEVGKNTEATTLLFRLAYEI